MRQEQGGGEPNAGSLNEEKNVLKSRATSGRKLLSPQACQQIWGAEEAVEGWLVPAGGICSTLGEPNEQLRMKTKCRVWRRTPAIPALGRLLSEDQGKSEASLGYRSLVSASRSIGPAR